MIARLTAIALAMVASIAIFGKPVGAGTWTELFDANNLPVNAQQPVGSGPLTSIFGHINGDFPDVDMYRIFIGANGPADAFSARVEETAPKIGWSSRLFLFDANGKGVMGVTQDQTPTLPANNPLSPQQIGIYYLAIATSNIQPFGPKDQFGNDFSIFPDLAGLGLFGPTGLGGNSPVASWGGSYHGENANYEIRLTGVSFIEAVTISEPTSLLLFIAGLVLLSAVAIRRNATQRMN